MVKSLKLELTEIIDAGVADGMGKVTYGGLIRLVLNTMPPGSPGQPGGVPTAEMERRVYILGELRKVEKDKTEADYPLILKLAKDDADYLVKLVRQQRWNALHEDLAKFTKAVDEFGKRDGESLNDSE